LSVREARAAVSRAFGAENRGRLLERYFADRPFASAGEAWKHVYRLLLWIDPTIGLAHCYESDKSQPGRPWYERSLRFHGWLSGQLGSSPADLATSVDWLFRQAANDLARGISERRAQLAAEQRAPYEGQGFPEPGEDPELEALILEALSPWLREKPPRSVLRDLAEQIHEYTRLENKRKNLVGEGFEDVLAALLQRLPRSRISSLHVRSYLHEIPGFFEAPGGEKPRKVDLAVLSGPERRRSLVTVKWSIRADREEQFGSDFAIYARLEKAGNPFDYVLVTNEFDPARLSAACRRQREGAPLFTRVVHVNPNGVLAAYGENLRQSFAKIPELVEDRRLMSLEDWLLRLQLERGEAE